MVALKGVEQVLISMSKESREQCGLLAAAESAKPAPSAAKSAAWRLQQPHQTQIIESLKMH